MNAKTKLLPVAKTLHAPNGSETEQQSPSRTMKDQEWEQRKVEAGGRTATRNCAGRPHDACCAPRASRLLAFVNSAFLDSLQISVLVFQKAVGSPSGKTLLKRRVGVAVLSDGMAPSLLLPWSPRRV